MRFHLDLKTLLSHADELGATRLVLTHMSEDMMGRLDRLDCQAAEDGKRIELSGPTHVSTFALGRPSRRILQAFASEARSA